MEFVYDLAGAGWANARIMDKEAEFELSASYLSDAAGDMAAAAVALLKGAKEATFCFQDEPGQHRFLLDRTETGGLVVRVVWNEANFAGVSDVDAEEAFRCESDVVAFAGQVAASLRAILKERGLEGYRQAWRAHAFPLEAYRELCSRLGLQDAE